MSTDDPMMGENWYRPTWEMELIISGALIVTLFQVPQFVDSAFDRVVTHVSRDVILLPVMAYVVCRYVINALIATFLVHFFVRSFWVGVLGLERVYPDGIDWEKLPYGPIMMSFYRHNVLDLEKLRKQADRVASMLFSILFVVLVNLLWMAVVTVCALPLTWLARSLFLGSIPLGKVFLGILMGVFVIVFVPSMIATVIDSRMKKAISSGKKKAPSGSTTRLIQRIYKFSYYASLAFMTTPAILVFKSHVSKLRMAVVIGALSIIFPVSLIVNMMINEGEIGIESYVYFPNEPRELGMSAQHYDNLRHGDEAFKVPAIQADYVDEPYVRLFLPFHATSDNAIVAEICPDLAPYREDGLVFGEQDEDENYDPKRNRTTLACLAKIFDIQIDENSLKELDFAFYVHPETSVHGLLTYIDIRSLKPGKHVLTIDKRKSKRQREKRDEGEDTRKTYTIPFWL